MSKRSPEQATPYTNTSNPNQKPQNNRKTKGTIIQFPEMNNKKQKPKNFQKSSDIQGTQVYSNSSKPPKTSRSKMGRTTEAAQPSLVDSWNMVKAACNMARATEFFCPETSTTEHNTHFFPSENLGMWCLETFSFEPLKGNVCVFAVLSFNPPKPNHPSHVVGIQNLETHVT